MLIEVFYLFACITMFDVVLYIGAAVGLDVTPERFTDPEIRRRLDCVTDIPGLYLTGQDTSVIGVTLAQLSGVTTAFRMTGFCSAVKIVLAAVLQGILAN